MFSARKSGAPAGGYTIANSLRFQSASSQSLSRTPASASNQQKFTYSVWLKRGALPSGYLSLFAARTGASGTFAVLWLFNDTLTFQTSATSNITTSAVYRDPSAWYHIVLSVDTTQATASNRTILYVNGVQVTAFSTATYPAQNTNLNINSTANHFIGQQNSTEYYDGYMTEINFIDGQALTPSSFGETNATTGQWIAKKYNGTYGTNGFYLPFSNGTSTTTLGADSSGNGNNWTLNNFTRSAGVSDCWMIDVPSGNSGASAVQPSSNYCTWNNLVYNAGGISFSNANLRLNYSSNIDRINIGNIATNTGKFYWEVTIAGLSSSSDFGIGICKQTLTNNTWIAFGGPNVIYYSTSSGWSVYGSNIGGATGSFSNGDVVGVSVDFDANVISIYQNNTLLTSRSGSIDTTIGHTVFGNSYRSGSTLNLNCGQRSFAYTPPSGFKALCTANLPTSTIVKGNQYMDATTYSGQGTNLTLVNAGGFQPDIVWMKCRSNADDNALVDSVRGVIPALYPNSTTAEISAGYLTSFNSNGVTITTGYGTTNIAGRTYVAWQWDAGSSTVTNTSGTISSQVRANPTAGVSVVTYTGNGSAGQSIGHGLGVAPKLWFIKNRSASADWLTYTTVIDGSLDFLFLNLTTAAANAGESLPTSNVFYNANTVTANTNGNNYVAYCFTDIAGFSKIGKYTGNGSTDGPMVWTGFTPRYVMIKQTNGANDWWVMDTARDPYNVGGAFLSPNLSNAESSGNVFWDALSNGFKLRNVYSQVNGSGNTYIYMAFASNPFAQSNAR